MEKNLSSMLNQKVEVLRLGKSDGGFSWILDHRRWAAVEPDVGRNIFSLEGVGSRGVTVTVRSAPSLTRHQALRWNGKFLLPTSIVQGPDRDRMVVRAALCTPVECQKDAHLEAAGIKFPGVLTEKYIGHEQLDPLAVVTRDYVLVVPKPVTLSPGSWVICAGEYYRVLVPHELDEYKNEYEIRRKEDC